MILFLNLNPHIRLKGSKYGCSAEIVSRAGPWPHGVEGYKTVPSPLTIFLEHFLSKRLLLSGAELLNELVCHSVIMCVIRTLVLNPHNFTDSNPILLKFGMSAVFMTSNKLTS